jgi:hypothetical protein
MEKKEISIKSCKDKQSCIDCRFDNPHFRNIFADHYHDEDGNRIECPDFSPDDKYGFFRGN